MTNKYLNKFRNRPENLTIEYFQPLLITQDSSPGCDVVQTSGKFLNLDVFLNLKFLLLRFLNIANNLKIFKRLIRNLCFEKHYFLSITCQVLPFKSTRFYTCNI